MKKELIIYGLAIGFNRGALLLLMPFLLYVFTIEEFGIYSYVQLLFQLIAPILCLNIMVAMSREGADNPAKALYLYKKILPYLIIITVVFCLLSYGLTLLKFDIIYVWITLLAATEAWHNMLLTYFRAAEKNWVFFIFSLSKTIGLLVIYIALNWFMPNASLYYYLLMQLLWSFILGSIYHSLVIKEIENNQQISLKSAILSSLILIPHSLALWIIASAGRFFIKQFWGNYELGTYSKIFNVAMILMIVNSGIGIVIPQQIIKNYEKWTTGTLRATFIKYYSLATLILYFILLSIIWIDSQYFQLLKINFQLNHFDFLLVFSGFYFLGYYYIYSNILFALRKNNILSLITSITALLSIVLNYFLIYHFKIIGASIAVFTTYIVYYMLTFFWAIKWENKIENISREIYSILLLMMFLVGLTILFEKIS